jgi:proline iminopeptidase
LLQGLIAIGKQVISFDPPESGHSTRPARLSLAEMHACANETLDTLGITTPVDALGHSMGGLTLLAYAIEYPARVRRLVLVGTGANRWAYMQAPGALAHPRHPGFWGMGLRALLHIALPCRASEALMNNYIDRWSFVDRQYVVKQVVQIGDWLRPRIGRADWHRIASRLDFTARLHELFAPTLVMCGRYDTQFPLAASQVLAAGIPNAQLAVFEHSGHFPFIEDREMFWQQTSEFLQV